MVISFVLAVAIMVLLYKASWFKDKYVEDYTEFLTYRPFGVKKGFKKWVRVAKMIETGQEQECKLAIIEADDLLKEVLQKMGYKQDLLEEILEKIDPKVLPSVEKITEAHKIRNYIIRNPDYTVTPVQARNIIRIYQKALTELEML